MTMELDDQFPESGEPAKSQLNVAMAELDKSRDAFYNECYRFASRPNINNTSDITDTADQTTLAVADVLRTILAAPELDQEERANIMATVFIGERDERVALFRGIFPNAGFNVSEATSREGMVDILLKMLEEDAEDETYVEVLTEKFQEELFDNIDDFLMEAVQAKHSSRWYELGRAARKHTIDIGKISAGVLIGGAILRRFDRLSR